MKTRLWGALALATVVVMGAVGVAQAQDPQQLPAVKVDLPPPPSWSVLDQPQKNPDGTMTVFGLRKQKKTLLGKDVQVKGFLIEIYQCPPCPKKQVCKACDQPHFYLGDKADTKIEKALLVVDYLQPKEKPPALTVGKEYAVDGQFNINSPSGFGSSDGLLVFSKMTDDKNKEFLSAALELEKKAGGTKVPQGGDSAQAAAIEADMKKRAAAKKLK